MGRRKANQETVPEYTSFPCYTGRRAEPKKRVAKKKKETASKTK